MLADLIDLQGASKAGKKWKAYPRPTKATDKPQRWGDLVNPDTGNARTRAEVVDLLNALGHSLS